MPLHSLQAWLDHTPLSPYVRDLVWAKALLESVHILADGLILYSAAALLTTRGAPEAARQVRSLWSALAVAAITGLVLLTGAGRRGLDNPMFAIKLISLLCAAALTVLLQRRLSREAGRGVTTAVAAACLLSWAATVFAGRFLAYASAFFPSFS